MIAASLYSAVASWTEAGVRPATALSYVGFALIEDALGREAITELGLPARTARRWRADLRRAIEQLDTEGVPAEPSADVMARVIAHLGG